METLGDDAMDVRLGGVYALQRIMEASPRDHPTIANVLATYIRTHTGIQWEYLPQGLGFGSGMTCRRRPAAWNEAGVWDALHLMLPKKLRAAKKLDWSRAVIGFSHVRAARRGPKADPARSTAHDRAAGTLSSPTGRASRSRCR